MGFQRDIIKECDTLFLDRDGVINVRIIDGYVTKPEEFIFINGVMEALSIFTAFFKYIFIVSNQQGIGKNLMTEKELEVVHNYMIDMIESNGGKITKIYYCPNLSEENHPDRKPGIGMGLKAKNDYPDVIFSKSLMVGDAKTDIIFGRNLNMKTAYIGSESDNVGADIYCDDLLQLAKILE